MKFVTFNIRYDCGRDGRNNFKFRKPLILRKIRQEEPDIICFQEVLPHVALWLKQSLREYYIIGCPRSETLEDEQVCIAFRSDRYNLMKMDTFWLSDTPYLPGSRYPEQSICPRTCTEAVFQELSSCQVFRVINTHFDHMGSEARLSSARQIVQRIQDETFFPDVPVIFTGDLNAEPDSPEIQLLAENMTLLTRDSGITYHGFGCPTPVQIDYIFTKGPVRCKCPEKWMDEKNGLYLSDHYPVCAEISFTGGCSYGGCGNLPIL